MSGNTEEELLLDVRSLARLLACSRRHVYRLKDLGHLPAPVYLGAAVRWRRKEIQEWIDASCPSAGRKGKAVRP